MYNTSSSPFSHAGDSTSGMQAVQPSGRRGPSTLASAFNEPLPRSGHGYHTYQFTSSSQTMSSWPLPRASPAMEQHPLDQSSAIHPPSHPIIRFEYQDYDDVMSSNGSEYGEEDFRSVLNDQDEGSNYAEPPLSEYQPSEYDAEERYSGDASEYEGDDEGRLEIALDHGNSQDSPSNWESNR
jgi:hypothetical protein